MIILFSDGDVADLVLPKEARDKLFIMEHNNITSLPTGKQYSLLDRHCWRYTGWTFREEPIK